MIDVWRGRMRLALTLAVVACARGPSDRHAPLDAAAEPVARAATQVPSPLPVPPGGELPLAIVLGPDAEVLDFTGPLEVFAAAWTEDGHPLFEPYFVAQTRDPVRVFGGMQVIPDYTFADAPPPKVVVIPALTGETPDMLEWLRTVSPETDVTMSVCNGAFVLARAGLLDGKATTAHHGGYFRLAGDFPAVSVLRGARFTESGNLASSGGISSGIDLALRVVARYLGESSARSIADGMEYQGPGWHDAASNGEYARMPDAGSAAPKCPLCWMDADPTLTSTLAGKTFAFCSPQEKQYFDEHVDVAERFLAEDAVAEASAQPPGRHRPHRVHRHDRPR
ncbi:MAG: DJ-1/PfpI family protein [Deltaproteobacteria bacterium]|nr:DJ-1/PfpI family protein [Deltaproteobacteria bacterium]MBP7287278.1 DJ-1/PfpI family protein [Nannocystaceae bacterium]